MPRTTAMIIFFSLWCILTQIDVKIVFAALAGNRISNHHSGSFLRPSSALLLIISVGVLPFNISL
jgi:hypothetical protein